jgi:hypothetical protein
MRGRKPDVQILDRAFKPIEQGLDYVPEDFAARVEPLSVDDIKKILLESCNIISMIMAQKGWLFTIVKKRLGHGAFKDWLKENRFNYTYVNRCMKVGRAVAKHPALATIGNTHVLRRVVYLPETKQAEIEVRLERKVRDTNQVETWRELRPWILEQIAGDLRERPKPKNEEELTKEETGAAQLKDGSDPLFDEYFELFMAWMKAGAKVLKFCQTHKLDPSFYNQVYEKKLMLKAGGLHSAIITAVNPPELVAKRVDSSLAEDDT